MVRRGVAMHGCWLQQSYQTDVGTKSLMRCYMALPVLPAPHIQPVFKTLVATSPPLFSPFISFIREQWIEGNIFTVTDLLCQFLKSEADIIEVKEVFREEKSISRIRAGFCPTSYFMAGTQKSTMFRIITCTGSKSTPCSILNIVYNILSNIVYYIYTFPIFN